MYAHCRRSLKVSEYGFRPAFGLPLDRKIGAAMKPRSVARAVGGEHTSEVAGPGVQPSRELMTIGRMSTGQIEDRVWLITFDTSQLNTGLQTLAALVSALGIFKQQSQPPLQLVRITSFSRLQRLLAVVGLGMGEQYLAVDRSELIVYRTPAALERAVLRMFKLNPGDAKVLAVSYTGGIRRTQALEPGTKVRAFIEAAAVLEVVDV